MHEQKRDLNAALALIDERWDTERTERTLSALQSKRRRNKRRVRALAGVAATCLLGAIAVALGRPTTPQPIAAIASSPLHMQLADGSDIVLRDAATRVVAEEVTAERVSVALLAGQACFDVVHRESRLFRVRSGDVTVEVLGTAFELERTATRTRVAVLRGRVAVTWQAGRAELSAGEAGWFPRTIEADARFARPVEPDTRFARPVEPDARSARPVEPDARFARPVEPGEGPLEAPAHGPKRLANAHKPPVTSASAWREPAEQGDFEHAYDLLARAAQPVADNVEELLLAADTARLSGHAQAALPYLKQVVAEHAQDSRAPLAAFTLGGVLMQQLGQPREAEAAYARARELSLNSSLAEDALARQVEAIYRAGDTERARALATEYLARYPRGRRVHAVQRFGGLTP